jgi:6-phosphogluconolactonase (cycloisomerase 2 family)
MSAVRSRLSFLSFSALIAFSFAAVLLTGCGSSNKNSSGTGGGGTGGGSPTAATSQEALYVASAGNNNASGWFINQDTSLTAISGSPFAVGGQSITGTTSAQFLFGVLGAPTPSGEAINTDTIGSDGSLKMTSNVPDSTLFGTAFINPAGSALYVGSISAAQGNSGWKIFAIQSDGSLKFITGVINQVAGRLVFTPDGSNAYTAYCYHLAANIQHYTVASDGTLTLTADQVQQIDSMTECPNAVAITGDGGMVAAPWSDADNVGPVDNKITAYTVDATTHSLTSIGGPFAASGTGVDATFDPSGKFLAVAQSNGVGVYQVTQSSVTEVAGSPFAGGTNFTRVMFSPSGGSLAALSREGGQLFVFSFNTSSGMLTTGPGSPVAIATPNDLVIIRH